MRPLFRCLLGITMPEGSQRDWSAKTEDTHQQCVVQDTRRVTYSGLGGDDDLEKNEAIKWLVQMT